MKIIGMIPARLGSKRIKYKNLRLLGGKPLICHTIEKCKNVKAFNKVFINSDGEIFNSIAKDFGISFYKRDRKLATDDATQDQFIYDFVNML